MKTYRKELWFEIPTRRAFINITSDIQKCINESGVTPISAHGNKFFMGNLTVEGKNVFWSK